MNRNIFWNLFVYGYLHHREELRQMGFNQPINNPSILTL
jgi:hypothetical protein